ncbi:MAG: proline iminopeptidase-family hydrolase [Ferrimicrobium sp.]
MSYREGVSTFSWQGESVATWYRVTGSPVSHRVPLVVLHGGPGATHDYLLSICDLAESGRMVVHYDQVGNGRSSHFPDRGADFYSVELFVTELAALIEALGIAKRHAILGQSWGGFLAQEYALTHPKGLIGLILANTAASFPAFAHEANRLRNELPPEVEATLRHHEFAGTTDHPEYVAACNVFYRRHVCRLPEWPSEIDTSFAWIDRDPTVYHTLNGPSEFHIIGSLKDWSARERISAIDTPTLILSGAHDEAAPALQEDLVSLLPNASWHRFKDSSHMPHWEEREHYMAVVGSFLNKADQT